MLNQRNLRGLWAAVFLVSLSACHHNPATSEEEMEEQEARIPKQDRMDKAWQQEFWMTLDPATHTVPRERLAAGRAYMERLQLARGTGSLDLSWQERGPNNIAGRTRAVLIDRQDATGNTVLAGGVGGGIWRTTNFKSTPTWTALTDKLNNIAITALAQDPVTKNIMYAGTGEGWGNSDAIRGRGIFKSINGGVTWDSLTATTPIATSAFDYVQDIVVTNAGAVLAACRSSRFCNAGGILRSTDGGVTWANVVGDFRNNPTPGSTQICDSAYNYLGADLEVAANGDLYATTGFGSSGISRQGRIFKSLAASNGAVGTWTDITPAGTWERIEIACAPSDANTIYALLEVNNQIGGIRRSRNGGASWETIANPEFCDAGTTKSDFTRGQAWYDLIAQVDPTNANTVVIGGIDLHRTTDGGATWTQITQWAANRCGSLPQIHADQHNLLFFPGSSTEFLASNDGGIYYTSNSGGAFTSKNGGYNVTQFYSIDIHPSNTNYFLGGAQDNATQKFTAPGINSTTTVYGGDGSYAHIDQTDGRIQIAAYVYNDYVFSRDGGVTFQQVNGTNEEGLFINPTDYDDVLDRLYTSNGPNTGTTIGNKMGIVTNLNGSTTPAFNEVTLTALGGRLITAIKVDPTVTAGGTAWVAATVPGGSLQPILLKLTNLSTLTPTVASTATLPATIAGGSYISSIDVDPANANHLLITLSNYGILNVYESTNGGTSWTAIDNGATLPDMPVRWGMFVPANAAVNGTVAGGILLGTELGVWYTPVTSGTATVWTPQNTGLPNTRVDMLRLRTSDMTLAAATHGRGLFTTTLTQLATGITTVPNTTGFVQYVSATPQQLYIKVGNLTTTRIDLAIYDVKGRLIKRLATKYADQTLNLDPLASGLYVLQLTGNKGERYVQKIRK